MKIGAVVVVALVVGIAPTSTTAQTTPSNWASAVWASLFTYSGCGGGGDFATCMSVDVRWNATTKTVGALVVNAALGTAGPGSLTRVGIVNLGTGQSQMGAGPGTSSTPYGAWNPSANNGLLGSGLPSAIWAWTTPQGNSAYSLRPGDSGFFSFALSPSRNGTLDPYQVGVAVHSQGGANCSTKFGVWQTSQGLKTNNNPANFNPACFPVPEPESMALLVTGLAGLAFVVARRREEDEVEIDAEA